MSHENILATAICILQRDSNLVGADLECRFLFTDNVPQAPAKTTRVVKASEFSNKTYLETEADVEAYIGRLKDELLKAVRSGQIARIQ